MGSDLYATIRWMYNFAARLEARGSISYQCLLGIVLLMIVPRYTVHFGLHNQPTRNWGPCSSAPVAKPSFAEGVCKPAENSPQKVLTLSIIMLVLLR